MSGDQEDVRNTPEAQKPSWNKGLVVIYINEPLKEVYKGLDMIAFTDKFTFLVFLRGKQNFKASIIRKCQPGE